MALLGWKGLTPEYSVFLCESSAVCNSGTELLK